MWYQRVVEIASPELQPAILTTEPIQIPESARPRKRRRHHDAEDRDEPSQFRRVRLRYWSSHQDIVTDYSTTALDKSLRDSVSDLSALHTHGKLFYETSSSNSFPLLCKGLAAKLFGCFGRRKLSKQPIVSKPISKNRNLNLALIYRSHLSHLVVHIYADCI